jgi:predicted ester cyclase
MSSPEEAKEVVRRWNDEGWSGGKYDLAYEIISPNMTVHGAGGQQIGMGPDALIDLIRTWRTAFPDGYMEIDDLIVEGDLVGIRNTWRGTQQAEFYGIPPSGNRVTVTSVGLDRVQDGKVVEGWGELDMVGMMQSLGAMPTAGPGAVANGKDASWGATVSEPAPAPASLADNKAILVRFVGALGSGDDGGVREVVDVGAFVDHNPVWGTQTHDDVLEQHAALRRALPDLRFALDEANLVAEGDQVAGHTLITGTHTGEELYGAAASGKPITWSHSEFVRIRDGKIVERWVSADTLTLFQQAGVLPGGG